jgi:hypothetical protein
MNLTIESKRRKTEKNKVQNYVFSMKQLQQSRSKDKERSTEYFFHVKRMLRTEIGDSDQRCQQAGETTFLACRPACLQARK